MLSQKVLYKGLYKQIILKEDSNIANLRGSDHFRQIKSGLMKMEKFGVSKFQTDSKDIHSEGVFKKREQILNEFSRYTQENNIPGKLNTLMTNENISNFLNTKLENLQANTVENYCRSFSAMVDSLRDNNISVSVDKTVFNEKVLEAKNNDNTIVRMNRAVDNSNKVISNLYEKHYHSGVIADVQVSLGLRLGEAIELTRNLDKYLDRNIDTVNEIIGKGGKAYISKEISQSLVSKIEAIDKHISKSTYMADLKKEGIPSHDFRYTFLKSSYDDLINKSAKGEISLTHNEILKHLSEQLNHQRLSMTNYYLKRA